jgi:DNA-binding GntR family transcriptional regulator
MTLVSGNGADAGTQVADQIRERIRTGRLTPGHRLVVSELTREFGVSRGPAREALSRLETEGLIEITPNRGAAVRQMSRRDVVELFEVREMLEGRAARLAAQNIDAGNNRVEMLEALAEAQRWSRTEEVLGYSDANEAFHNLVFLQADQRLLSTLVGQTQTHVYRVLVDAYFSIDRVRAASVQHEQIIEAILAGDGTRAEAAMQRHVRDTRDATLTLQRPFFPTS